MAKIDLKLPHTQVKYRNGYEDVYFIVHPKDRPVGWKPSYPLGRTDQDTLEDIIKRSHEYYEELLEVRGQNIREPRRLYRKGTLPDIICKYRASHFYTDLKKTTQITYDPALRVIEDWSGRNEHPHIKQLTAPALVKFLNTFEKTPEKQKRIRMTIQILCRIAIMEGYITFNPVNKDLKLRRRQTEKRKIILWTDDDIGKFIDMADAMGRSSVGTAVLIGYETGQRKEDVLSLEKPRDYKDGKFIFEQSKTGKEVRIKTTRRLQERLNSLPKEQLMLVRNENTKRQWNRIVFTERLRKIANEAGLTKHIFQQLRHSAVNNLERAGNTVSQISAVTGHSRDTVVKMLDSHYGVDHDEEMAEEAINNLENYREQKAKGKPA